MIGRLGLCCVRWLLGLTVGVTPFLAVAQTFTPIAPPTCPSFTTDFSYKYYMGAGTNVFEQASDPNCVGTVGNECPHYINNITFPRKVVGNEWTSRLDFLVESVQMQDSADTLCIGTSLPCLTGSVSGLWKTAATWNTGSIIFQANGQNSGRGFWLSGMRVCTEATSPFLPNTLEEAKRTVGLLQGTNDVVYFSMLIGNTTDHAAITAFSGVSGLDMDIYARCGALPTPSQWGWRGFSSDDQEYFDVSGCNGTVYLAVHSYSGSGPFNIIRNTHKPSAHKIMRVQKNWTGAPDYLPTASVSARNGARLLYGATEGNIIIDEVWIFNGNSCASCGGATCDLCYKNIPGAGGGQCSLCPTNPDCEVITNDWSNVSPRRSPS